MPNNFVNVIVFHWKRGDTLPSVINDLSDCVWIRTHDTMSSVSFTVRTTG